MDSRVRGNDERAFSRLFGRAHTAQGRTSRRFRRIARRSRLGAQCFGRHEHFSWHYADAPSRTGWSVYRSTRPESATRYSFVPASYATEYDVAWYPGVEYWAGSLIGDKAREGFVSR